MPLIETFRTGVRFPPPPPLRVGEFAHVTVKIFSHWVVSIHAELRDLKQELEELTTENTEGHGNG